MTSRAASGGHDAVGDDFRVWEGVYGRFADAPAAGEGFLSDAWLDRVRKRTEALLAKNAADITGVHDYLLPVVAAMATTGSGVTIVDYGGGVGAEFVAVAQTLPPGIGLAYHVVDNPRLCALGRKYFAGDSRIRFHEAIQELPKVDVVHLGSCLQYVEDWRDLLVRLCRLAPAYVLLSDTFAGDIEPFVTLQNFYGSRIPHQFINARELEAWMEEAGYALCLRVPYLARILGQGGPLPMAHFPPERRIDHAAHFLFSKQS